MHDIAFDLLILLGGVWLVTVTLRPLGLPTIMGELIVGVVLGPAVLGLTQPGELIQLLAEIGFFFLMFHAGVETQPLEFLQALKHSMGVAVAVLMGRYVYPRLTLPFRSEGGKGFTFILVMALALGLFADAIGLHMILGAYLAGLFFEGKVAHPNLVRSVKDPAYGIAYSFLGPIFFISLGFSITFDISIATVVFIVVLTLAVIVGQIASAGGMALRIGLPPREALTVGVGNMNCVSNAGSSYASKTFR